MLPLLLACATAAPPAPPAPSPDPQTLRGEPLAFSDWFAPAVTVSAAQPGTYTSTVDYRFSGFITMERTVSRWSRSETTVTIAADGAVTGCAQGKHGSRSSVSQYASHDGESHVQDNESEFLWGFRGRWERSGGWLLVWLEATSWQDCAVPEDAYTHDVDGLLMCAQAALPSAALVCHPVGSGLSNPLREHVALPIGPPAEAAAVRAPGTEWQGRAWLVLGAGPGLSIAWQERDSDPTPSVSLTVP